jgi:8-oxo-dGTP pyrophosphatase MutT (NUDIX family)
VSAPAGVPDAAGPRAPRIRTLAVADCVDGGRALVERGHDRVAGRPFHRAIGGAIEFGERAAAAAAREWREELGLTLADVRLLGVLENLFTYEGRPGHEVVFVHRARIVEPHACAQDVLVAVEPSGLRHEAVWLPLDTLRDGPVPLVPAGLATLLDPRMSADR